MSFKNLKASYISGLGYLTHQQQYEMNEGGIQLLNRRFRYSRNLFKKDLYAHYGCVNAIEFSNDGQWMISGGDDKRVLVWKMIKTLTSSSNSYQPTAMKSEHNSNIFCLAFNKSHTKLLSAGNDEQVILHDINTRESLDVFPHQEAVYGLSADPMDDNLFATSCDDGRVLIWDIRQSIDEPLVLASNANAYHAVMHNPVEPHFLATANAKEGVCLWDIRKPNTYVIKYGSSLLTHSAMSVRFNATGNHLLALRRRLPPVLYDVTSAHHIAEFDHPEYYNSCTMKSCCFAGDKDQYVLSGSDDFKLYIWEVPDVTSRKGNLIAKTHFVLRGHRSIVNQVRYNNTYGVIASSGVEKIIKLWSSFPMSHSDESEAEGLRKVYSHEEYINLVLRSGQFMTHDYSHHSTREDPRMMAFFDSLVQRDIEGWTSDSNDASERTTRDGFCFEVQSSEDSTTSISSSSSEDELENITQRSKRALLEIFNDRLVELPSTFSSTDRAAANNASSNNQNTDSHVISNEDTAPNSSIVNEDRPLDRASTNRVLNISQPASEVGVTRRLFSDRDGMGGRILTDTDSVISRYFSGREGATSRLFANREEAASYLLINRQTVSTHLNNNETTNEDSESNERNPPTSDRISQLIAQKRRVQKLKSARKSMKRENVVLRKFKRTSRKSDKRPSEENNEVGFRPLNLGIGNKKSASLNAKIKLLRKKRAQLSKTPNLDGNSSDSDDYEDCKNNVQSASKLCDMNSVSNGNKKKNEESDSSNNGLNYVSNGNKRKNEESDSSNNGLNYISNGNKRKNEESDSSNNGITKVFFKRSKSFKKISDTTNDLVNSQNPQFKSDLLKDSSDASKSSNLNSIWPNSETNKSPCCSGVSSNTNACENSFINEYPIPNDENEIRENLSSSINDSDSRVVESSVVNRDKTNCDESSELNNSILGSTNKDLNGTEIPSDNSNSSFCFPISVVKHGRNYRKRNIEDSNED
ncbi:uncharacterized protein [Parasteatoda tepidariorum]|uniref:uncharacterized protein n=1 Tax=Parasteatoda tepidariorum TaxID=114398 RepID=UPI001C723495|nr:uncharacterized protein LOC107447648 [Parasteatoda tepidariorum]